MSYSLQQIAEALSARLEGDGSLSIDGAAEPADARDTDLALAMKPEFADRLPEGAARAAILWEGADWRAMGLSAALFVPRPRYALAGVTRLLDPGPEIAPGIHPTAVIDPAARIGADPAIGPFVVVGAGAVIGDRARIAAHASVGEHAVIGDDVLLNAGVRIAHRVTIGHRFIANPGAVVGGDGLSFVTPEKSGVERARETMGEAGPAAAQSGTRIHSLGGVEIGDDVELGANACIDRGTIRATRVGSGCKIDNLVHIAHNVVVGRDCLMAALTGIAGSTTIGDRCVFGGQTGIVDNIFVGDDVIAAGGTKILSNVPKGRVVMGYPAVKMEQHVEIYKALRRLPRLMRDLATGQKAVQKPGPTD